MKGIWQGMDNNTPEEDIKSGENSSSGPGIKKILLITGIIVFSLIAVMYTVAAVWFSFHYNYRTYINGVDYSFYSLDEVGDVIEGYIEDYSLTIKTREGGSYVIEPEDIDLLIEPSTTAKKIHSTQNGFLWIYYIFVDKTYELTYSASYDEEKLREILGSMDFVSEKNMEKPEDARVAVEDGEAVIISEKDGNYIDFEKLCAIIDEALVSGSSDVNIDDKGAYEEPKLFSDSEEIVSSKAELDKLLEMTITYRLDEVTWELDSEVYGDWLSYSDGSWTFSHDDIRKYVEDIAKKYDTYGTDREFVTHDGDKLTLCGWCYGWQIDVDGETEELEGLLKEGKSVDDHVPSLDATGAAYTENGDIGYSYIECDMGEQHIYVYVDGRLKMESDCVTGSISGGYATPEGVYCILYKKSPALLVGEDYKTPVTYWIPFIASEGIGFHDATWRGSFGGSIYKNSGSHGCVNLPYSAAEKLFNIVYNGMPVICYY